MRFIASAAVVVALFSTAAFAQNLSVIKEREEHFEAMGKASKAPGAMFKGEAPFDLAQVQAALKVYQEKAAILPKLFPDDSKTGGDTEALPAIWEKKADFEERFVKFAASAKAAEGSITNEETFAAVWKDVVGNCSGCHKAYRKPKS